ncbi:hypothetical protein [Streptomyces sp. NPDC048737]
MSRFLGVCTGAVLAGAALLARASVSAAADVSNAGLADGRSAVEHR